MTCTQKLWFKHNLTRKLNRNKRKILASFNDLNITKYLKPTILLPTNFLAHKFCAGQRLGTNLKIIILTLLFFFSPLCGSTPFYITLLSSSILDLDYSEPFDATVIIGIKLYFALLKFTLL